MRWLRLIPALLCLLISAGYRPARAQTFNTQTGRENITSLDGLWRFHTGDNPAWASPNFDDSQWPLLRSDESWAEQGYPGYGGYAWYRFAVQVPDGGKPLDLLLPQILTGYQVYADGKQIGSAGSTAPTRDPFAWAPPEVFRLPASGAGPRTVQIALRVWDNSLSSSYVGGGPQAPGSAVGDPALLNQRLHRQRDAGALAYVSDYAYCLLEGLVGLTILVLFLFRREDREYLWFSVLLLAEVAHLALGLVFDLGSIPYVLFISIRWTAVGLTTIAALAFFSTVLGVRRSWPWWVACIAAAASPLPAALMYFQWAGLGASFGSNLCFLLPAYAWILVALAIRAFQKDISARLLLFPAALYFGFWAVYDVVSISWIFGWQRKLRTLELALVRYPFPLRLGNLVDYIFVFGLLIFLVRRFSLARQHEMRLSNEMEAARGIQSLLVPSVPPDTPGFVVESVYIPASEVGGDFFQVLPADDGALLVVVGDVSGKGLKAAMTVSTIVGALRNEPSRQPAEVLARLNRVLHGQITGFVTCSATSIAADGAMTLANAGHLSPYRNGEELAVDPGLALGILAEISYAETSYQLAPGDRLTFVSDGVVEATNGKKELFGFERTQAISRQPANAIAEAARQFGQEDDISVVTIARTLQAVPA